MPGAKEHELGRELRDLLPGPEPEEREPDAREDARAADPAALLAEAARGREARVVGREAGQAERGVRLERRGEVGLAAPVDRPEPSGRWRASSSFDAAARRLLVAKAQELEQEQVLRRHGHVRLELADPPAARLLQLEQALDARVERAVEAGPAR